MDENRSLADAYPIEQARIRELLQAYKDVGPPGAFAHVMLSDVANRADKAAAEQDLVSMIRLYQEMKGCK